LKTSAFKQIEIQIMKKFKIFALVLTIGFSIAAIGVHNNDKLFEIAKNIEIYTSIYKEINTHFVDEIDPSQLMKTGIDAMLESLDPYTNYYSESQIEGFRFMTTGKYNGIGARIRKVEDYPTVIEMFEESPALKSGLKVGDIIYSIDGQSAKGKNSEEVGNILRGVPDSKINMTIKPVSGGGNKTITLTRGEVSVENVPYSGMLNDKIGYVVLTTFTRNAGANVGGAIKKLKEDNPNMEGLVFDLRNNGGGLLREAVNVSNLFIPKNEVVVTTKGKVKERDQSFKTLNNPLNETMPVVVLINKNTASASEIVSGVLQDLDRAVVLGQRSYGKGLVQNTKDVGYNSQIKLTTSKYYIPSGRCIQSVKYEDGEPVDIPDTQRTVFKTRNGRNVLDGGGITPDVKFVLNTDIELLNALNKEYHIFKYVNDFANKHQTIAPVDDFKYTDYDSFLNYLKANNFEYESKSEKYLNNLKEDADKKGITLDNEIVSIEAKIKADKKLAYVNHRAEILDAIEKEIVSRYYFQNGKAQQQLNNDREIDEAIALLNDSARYQSILSKK